MIDWSRVQELREELGAEDFDEVVALFLAEVDGAVETLETHSGDLRSVEERMHFLKGAALNLGFSALSQLCGDGEKAAARGDPETPPPSRVRACFEASKAAFSAEYAQRFAA